MSPDSASITNKGALSPADADAMVAVTAALVNTLDAVDHGEFTQ